MLVTCPESAHLEEIELVFDPLRILVVRCSAFGADCPMACARTCAARLERKRRDRDLVGSVLEVRSCLR